MSSPPELIIIENHHVGPHHPPFMVAELSANHGGDFDRAIRIIDRAAAAGAHAIKFQAYTADSLTLDTDRAEFLIDGKNPWSGQRLHALYQSAATPYEWFPGLFQHCREKGVIPFASPFDQHAINMLESVGCNAYKIASFEAVDHELISACAKTGKPLIVSVGLCTQEEIREAVSVARAFGASDVLLLQCNSAYPSPPKEANLLTIPNLISRYGVLAGYSDHTLDSISSVAACALGACVIEKHVIDSRVPETPDSSFSVTPPEFERLTKDCYAAWKLRGTVRDGPTASEQGNLAFRRSLFAVSDISAGEPFTETNIASLRPGHGMAPKHLAKVLTKIAKRDILEGEPLNPSMMIDGDGEGMA